MAQAAGAASLRSATELDDSQDLVNENSASFVTADRMETTDDEIYLTGNAEVRRAGTVIRGDKITYTQSTDTVNVKGNAVVIRQGVRFDGPELTYQIETQSGEMQDVSYEYAVKGVRGQSKYSQFTNGVNTQFRHATLTTCKPGSKAWWIEADTLTIDESSQMAYAEDVSFHLAGLPVLATPWAMFPTGTERQSGLLTPTMGMSSRRGFEFAIPIYWNIAPNYDYTFTPHVMTKRGVILGNEFRFLTPYMGGELTYDYLSEDKETNDSRYAAKFEGWAQWNGLRLNVDYNKVSDGQYISDFSNNIYDTSESILDQNYTLSYGADFWHSSLSVQKNQPLARDDGTEYSKPYEKVPQLQWRGYLADLNGFEVSSLFEATRFKHPDKARRVQGDRFYMNHSVAYPVRGPGWFVTPKAMVTGIAYNLDGLNQLTGSYRDVYDKNSSLFAPSFSLDTGLIFERETSWFGDNALQTLEPRIFYTYTPYRDQDRMPTFDSSYADLSFSSFFSENLFTGHDRLSEANQVSLVLTSRYLDRKSGNEFLRASIGQRYYFSDQRIPLYRGGTIGVTDNVKSDFLASVSAKLTKDVSTTATAQYSTSDSRFTRINAGIRWHPKPSAVLGLYYRYNYVPDLPQYRDDRIKQIDFAVQWPLTDSLYGLARYNYSLYDKEPVEVLGGIEYVADCWALRLVAQRYLTDESRYDTTFYVQLELTGLGSVGSNPLEELRRNIPGYQSPTAMPGLTGLYDYYE